MQIPTEWYVHILPGIVIICSFLIVARNVSPTFLDLIRNHLVGSAVVIGICAYLIGFSENVIILYALRPILTWVGIMDPPLPHSTNDWVMFYQFAPRSLIDATENGYQNMLLYRSLFGASIVICVAIAWSFFVKHTYRGWRCAALVSAILLTFCLHQLWWHTRAGYMQFTPQALKSTSQLQQK